MRSSGTKTPAKAAPPAGRGAIKAKIVALTDAAVAADLERGAAHLDAELIRVGQAVVGYKKPRRIHPIRRASFSQVRRVEIEKLIAFRHGPGGCSTDDASVYVEVAALYIEPNELVRWARAFAPGATPDEVSRAIEWAAREPRRLNADQAARELGVTLTERQLLRFRTIGAKDVSTGERLRAVADEKRAADRERARIKRAAAGVGQRRKGDSAEEEAERLGVSRATIMRRRRVAKAGAAWHLNVANNRDKSTRDFQVSPAASVKPALPAAVDPAVTAMHENLARLHAYSAALNAAVIGQAHNATATSMRSIMTIITGPRRPGDG